MAAGKPDRDNRLLNTVKENIVPFGFSLGMIGVGAFLFLDDAGDFATFSTPEHPSHIHHWWVGLLILILGLILLLYIIFKEA